MDAKESTGWLTAVLVSVFSAIRQMIHHRKHHSAPATPPPLPPHTLLNGSAQQILNRLSLLEHRSRGLEGQIVELEIWANEMRNDYLQLEERLVRHIQQALKTPPTGN